FAAQSSGIWKPGKMRLSKGTNRQIRLRRQVSQQLRPDAIEIQSWRTAAEVLVAIEARMGRDDGAKLVRDICVDDVVPDCLTATIAGRRLNGFEMHELRAIRRVLERMRDLGMERREMEMNELPLSQRELADYLATSESTIKRMCRIGNAPPFFMIG